MYQEFIESKGFNFVPNFTGTYQRFDGLKPNSGWSISYFIMNRPVITFGDWVTGETHHYQSNVVFISKEEEKKYKELLKEKQTKIEEDRVSAQNAAKEIAQKIILDCEQDTHPYLFQKGFPHKLGLIHQGNLIVPLRDIEGIIWNVQKIKPNFKSFLENGKIKSCFHLLGEMSDDIMLCEGYATGLSIQAAGYKTVICAMNSGNLKNVSEALREKFPQSKITVCADNDAFTMVRGLPHNTGLLASEKVKELGNIEIRYPNFKTINKKHTDFNDLHQAEGIEEVKQQLKETTISRASVAPNNYSAENGGELSELLDSLSPVPFSKKIPPSSEVIKPIVSRFGDQLCKASDRIMIYRQNYWQEMTEHDEAILRAHILRIANHPAFESRHVDAAISQLKNYLKVPTNNIFTTNPNMVNFKNGTVHINKELKTISLKPHNPDDYCTHVLPFDFNPESTEVNQEFDAMLDRICGTDEIGKSKKETIEMMLGACLFPVYTGIFFVYGPPGTGKSTLIRTIDKILGKNFISHVDPTQFEAPYESYAMVGKLVNICTDINTKKAIPDHIMKKIEDRDVISTRQIYSKRIEATLPAIHIFGTNDFPKNMESNAFDRRVIILELNNSQTKGNYSKNYLDEMISVGRQGILNFMVRGFHKLLQNGGHFKRPINNEILLDQMKTSSNPIKQFMDELLNEEIKGVKVSINEDAYTERDDFFNLYAKWCESQRLYDFKKWGFFDNLQKMGFHTGFRKSMHSRRSVKGISVTFEENF